MPSQDTVHPQSDPNDRLLLECARNYMSTQMSEESYQKSLQSLKKEYNNRRIRYETLEKCQTQYSRFYNDVVVKWSVQESSVRGGAPNLKPASVRLPLSSGSSSNRRQGTVTAPVLHSSAQVRTPALPHQRQPLSGPNHMTAKPGHMDPGRPLLPSYGNQSPPRKLASDAVTNSRSSPPAPLALPPRRDKPHESPSSGSSSSGGPPSKRIRRDEQSASREAITRALSTASNTSASTSVHLPLSQGQSGPVQQAGGLISNSSRNLTQSSRPAAQQMSPADRSRLITPSDRAAVPPSLLANNLRDRAARLDKAMRLASQEGFVLHSYFTGPVLTQLHAEIAQAINKLQTTSPQSEQLKKLMTELERRAQLFECAPVKKRIAEYLIDDKNNDYISLSSDQWPKLSFAVTPTRSADSSGGPQNNDRDRARYAYTQLKGLRNDFFQKSGRGLKQRCGALGRELAALKPLGSAPVGSETTEWHKSISFMERLLKKLTAQVESLDQAQSSAPQGIQVPSAQTARDRTTSAMPTRIHTRIASLRERAEKQDPTLRNDKRAYNSYRKIESDLQSLSIARLNQIQDTGIERSSKYPQATLSQNFDELKNMPAIADLLQNFEAPAQRLGSRQE